MDKSRLLQCPYDKSHHILPERFQVHLIRCRRTHLNSPKVTCPFNVTHVLNKQELDHHVAVCPERLQFEKFNHREESAASSQAKSEPNKFALPPLESTENWNDEEDVPSYNPQAYAVKANIFRTIQGATKSERKEFRRQERERLQKIKN